MYVVLQGRQNGGAVVTVSDGSPDPNIIYVDVDEPYQTPVADYEGSDDANCCLRTQSKASQWLKRYSAAIKYTVYGIMIAAYAAYFAYAVYYEGFVDEDAIRLFWVTLLVVFMVLVSLIAGMCGSQIYNGLLEPMGVFLTNNSKVLSWLVHKKIFQKALQVHPLQIFVFPNHSIKELA